MRKPWVPCVFVVPLRVVLWCCLTQTFWSFTCGAPPAARGVKCPPPPSNPHPSVDMEARPTDEGLVLLMLYIVQLLWLENKPPPNLVALKQCLCHSPVFTVDRALQGRRISAPLGVFWGVLRARTHLNPQITPTSSIGAVGTGSDGGGSTWPSPSVVSP